MTQTHGVDSGAWVACPRCGLAVGLGRFAESDEEPETAVAVCPGCGERIDLWSGRSGPPATS